MPCGSVEEIRSLLKRQLVEPVQWERGTRNLAGSGECAEYLEVGPGRQLKAMMRRIDRRVFSATSCLGS